MSGRAHAYHATAILDLDTCGPAWSWLLFVQSAKSSGLIQSSRTGGLHWPGLLGSTLQDDVWQIAPGVDWLLKKPWELCSRRWGARGANRSISTTPVRLQNFAGRQSAAKTPGTKIACINAVHGMPQRSSDLLLTISITHGRLKLRFHEILRLVDSIRNTTETAAEVEQVLDRHRCRPVSTDASTFDFQVSVEQNTHNKQTMGISKQCHTYTPFPSN